MTTARRITGPRARRTSFLVAAALVCWSVASGAQGVGTHDLSKSVEWIHQEVVVDASPARVYAVLTSGKEFSGLTAYSMVPKSAPAQIENRAGGAFVLFDGHVTGRNIELVPGTRVVQAWRAADWEPGLYSIARFELKPEGARTRIVFDHTGFPHGQGEHLAQGWGANYWTPMQKYLK